MALATRRLSAGRYAITGTRLVVERGEAPRYGYPQEWDICPADDRQAVLLTGKGKADALGRLERILKLAK